MKDHELDNPLLGVLLVVGFIVITLVAFAASSSFINSPAAPDRLSEIERKLEEMASHLECVGREVGAGKLTVSARIRGREYFEWDLKPRSYGASLMSSLGGGSETDAKIDRLAVQLDRVAKAVGLPPRTDPRMMDVPKVPKMELCYGQ